MRRGLRRRSRRNLQHEVAVLLPGSGGAEEDLFARWNLSGRAHQGLPSADETAGHGRLRRRRCGAGGPVAGWCAAQGSDDLFELDGPVQIAHAQQQHLDEDAGPTGAPQASARLQVRSHGQHPDQVARGKGRRTLGERLVGLCTQVARLGVRVQGDAQQETEAFRQPVVELDQLVPLVQQPLDKVEDRPVPALGHQVEELQVALFGDHAQHPDDSLHRDLAAGQGQHLVQHRKRVAHPAVGLASDRPERAGVVGDAFAVEDFGEAFHDVASSNAPEVESLAAREDRRRRLLDLLGFGRGEDEDYAGRRLLQDLEEGVPRLAREHVGLVEDVDLVAAFLRGGVHGAFAQFPGVVHSAVGCGVDLHDVQRRVAPPDAGAVLAAAAGLAVGLALRAVEGHRQDPGQRGLADAPRAAEEVGVADPSPRQSVLESLGDVFLGRDVAEAAGPVLSSEGEVGQGRRL